MSTGLLSPPAVTGTAKSAESFGRRVSQLRFQDATALASRWGDAILVRLDSIGERTLRALGRPKDADPSPPVRQLNRPSWGALLAATATAVLIGLFGWAAFANSQGGDTWRTAPGVGDIEINSHLPAMGGGMAPGSGANQGTGMAPGMMTTPGR